MTTWIFLRGLTRDSRHWGDFPARFQAALPEAAIVTLDLPGNGERHEETSPVRVERMAEECRAELRARGLHPPYRLLAMSLGAMVAVAWAAAHPEELAAAVLINTSLRPFSPLQQRLRPRNYPRLLRLALPGVTAIEWERTVLALTSNLAPDRESLLRQWIHWHERYPVSRRNALRQLWAASRYRAPRQRPAVPLLVLASAADQLVDPACSRRLAAQWHTAYDEHPTAGHDLPLDDGAWLAARIAAWQRERAAAD